MEVSFRQIDGSWGISTASWTNWYEYTTIAGETDFSRLLGRRGFLDFATDGDERKWLVASRWELAKEKMPANYPDALRKGEAHNTIVPTGTKLWLQLTSVPDFVLWGSAVLSGENIVAAYAAIQKVLDQFHVHLDHSGPADLLEHVINTPVRTAAGITIVTAAARSKPLSGTLYFRACRLTTTYVPVAGGLRKAETRAHTIGPLALSSHDPFIAKLRAQLTLRDVNVAKGAQVLKEVASALEFWAQVHRNFELLFHVGNMISVRGGDAAGFDHPNELVHLADVTSRETFGGILPKGAFRMRWWDTDFDLWMDLTSHRASTISLYEELATKYAASPRVWEFLVEQVCQSEIRALTAMAQLQFGTELIKKEIDQALDWWVDSEDVMPSGTNKSTCGILLGLLNVTRTEADRHPSGLNQFVLTLTHLAATLGHDDAAGRDALDRRVRKAVAKLLILPEHHRDLFMKPGVEGWRHLHEWFDTVLSAVKKTKPYAAGTKALTRSVDVLSAIAKVGLTREELNAAGKASLALWNSKLQVVIDHFKVLGFITAGISLVEDAAKDCKLGDHRQWTSWEQVEGAMAKTGLDAIALWGTTCRDYYLVKSRMGALLGRYGTPEAVKEVESLGTKLKLTGYRLGVFGGLGNAALGMWKGDSKLTLAGVLDTSGYVLKKLATRLAAEAAAAVAEAGEAGAVVEGSAVVLGAFLSPEIVAVAGTTAGVVSAGLAIWSLFDDPKADEAMSAIITGCAEATLQQIEAWFRRQSAGGTSDFDRQLERMTDELQTIKNAGWWKNLRPWSEDDVNRMRRRLNDIGADFAYTVLHNESASDVLVRRTWNFVTFEGFAIPKYATREGWPTQWPGFDIR